MTQKSQSFFFLPTSYREENLFYGQQRKELCVTVEYRWLEREREKLFSRLGNATISSNNQSAGTTPRHKSIFYGHCVSVIRALESSTIVPLPFSLFHVIFFPAKGGYHERGRFTTCQGHRTQHAAHRIFSSELNFLRVLDLHLLQCYSCSKNSVRNLEYFFLVSLSLSFTNRSLSKYRQIGFPRRRQIVSIAGKRELLGKDEKKSTCSASWLCFDSPSVARKSLGAEATYCRPVICL